MAPATTAGQPSGSTAPLADSKPAPSSDFVLATMPDSAAQLIVLSGTYAGKRCRFLVDGGSTGDFISTAFLQLHKLPWPRQATGRRVLLPDKSSLESYNVPSQPISIGSYSDKHVQFLATGISSNSFDAVLGKPWLAKLNPAIDWQSNTVALTHHGHRHVLRPPLPPLSSLPASNCPVLNATQLARQFGEGDELFPMTLRDPAPPPAKNPKLTQNPKTMKQRKNLQDRRLKCYKK